MQHFTSFENFESQYQSHDWTLLYFSASWCGPCKTMSPIMEGVSQKNDSHLNVIKIDVDEAQQLAAQYGIRSIPTLVLLNSGQQVDTLVGAQPPPQIQSWLNGHL